MPSRTDAEEHLRIIRSLMEKATIYRAISAPTALIGGLFSVGFGAWLFLRWQPSSDHAGEACGPCFIWSWITVLVITMASNGLLIWSAARKRQEPFISPAMRKALWALLPPMLCGAVSTFLLGFHWGNHAVWNLPPIWMIFYGLGLLATAQFAPRSIPILGWCFVLAGLTLIGAASFGPEANADTVAHLPSTANLSMLCTFGFFHLVYAASTWPRRNAEGDTGGTP
jgi:hypothetical protein